MVRLQTLSDRFRTFFERFRTSDFFSSHLPPIQFFSAPPPLFFNFCGRRRRRGGPRCRRPAVAAVGPRRGSGGRINCEKRRILAYYISRPTVSLLRKLLLKKAKMLNVQKAVWFKKAKITNFNFQKRRKFFSYHPREGF